ncbi:hypothetical protein [Roseobacter cerasinus]|uniref:hypothetical protein n=1 Tax=Roseobacter cerasinus TaxID=2602289 RepID=UPI001358828C|nr:hypothetical protein [Roseobacter cerasinus]
MLVPARDAADASVVSQTLPEEFLDGYHPLRCVAAGSSNPSLVRQAFAPLPVLETEIPYQPGLCDSVVSSSIAEIAPSSNEKWNAGCLSLAHEIAELVERPDECLAQPNVGLIAT